MPRLIILISILLSAITLTGCDKRIGSIPNYLIGDWVAIDFDYDEFPDIQNNYAVDGITRIKIRSDKYFNGQQWIPIDLGRLTVKSGNSFMLFDKNSKHNDGWQVDYLDNPNRRFKRYKGSIFIQSFTGVGDEYYEQWISEGYFEKRR